MSSSTYLLDNCIGFTHLKKTKKKKKLVNIIKIQIINTTYWLLKRVIIFAVYLNLLVINVGFTDFSDKSRQTNYTR